MPPDPEHASPAAIRGLLTCVDLLEQGRRAEARAELERVVASCPRSPVVHIAAATVRFVLCDFQLAIDALDEAIRLAGPATAMIARTRKVALLSRLNWLQEARETLEDCTALEPQRAAHRIRAAELFFGRKSWSGALPHLDAAIALEPHAANLWMQRAAVLGTLGRATEADASVRGALERAPGKLPYLLEAARVRTEIGELETAAGDLERAIALFPASALARVARGELALWAGDHAEAARHAEAALRLEPDSARAHCLLGGARVLRRDLGGAVEALDRALALEPRAYDAYIWRGEAQLGLGRFDAASADVDRGIVHAQGFLLVGRILRLLTTLLAGEIPVSVGLSATEELREGVLELCPGSADVLDEGAPGRVTELLLQALAALRGNRTMRPTFADAGGRLRLVSARPGPRHAGRAALDRIALEPADVVLAALDEVMRDFPESALPRCYRGELRTWLGDADEARADLEGVIEIHPYTRWAYAGLTWLETAAGRLDQAFEICALGVRRMNNTEGPAIFAVRGEVHRRLGDVERALADLRMALEHRPARTAARVNLGLALADAGDTEGQAAVLAELRRDAPGLVSDAAHLTGLLPWDGAPLAPGDVQALLSKALEMMRGNRSSTIVTYFGPSGRLRFVPPPNASVLGSEGYRSEDLASLRALLRRALATAVDAPGDPGRPL